MGLCLDAADEDRVLLAFFWLSDADFAEKASPGHFKALWEQSVIRGSRRTMSFSFYSRKNGADTMRIFLSEQQLLITGLKRVYHPVQCSRNRVLVEWVTR